MKKSDWMPYLTTLRRVPADIILSVATRDINLRDANTCVCGWVIREAIARRDNVDAEDAFSDAFHADACRAAFGDTGDEWDAIYFGVSYECAPLIERAFVERVLECVG